MSESNASIACTAGSGERWVVEQSAVVLAAVARHLRRIGSECRTPIARELYDFDRVPYPIDDKEEVSPPNVGTHPSDVRME